MSRSWLSRLLGPTGKKQPLRRRGLERLCLEALEERLAPATFTEAGTTLDLVLGAGEKLGIVSNGPTYALSLTGGTWSGTDSANVSGNTSPTLTVTHAGI